MKKKDLSDLVLDEHGQLLWIDPKDPERDPLIITNRTLSAQTKVQDGPKSQPTNLEIDAHTPIELLDVTKLPEQDLEIMANLTDEDIDKIILDHNRRHAFVIYSFIKRLRDEWKRRRKQ